MKESNKKKNHKQKTVFPNKKRGSFFARFIVMFVLCFLVLFSSGVNAAWLQPAGTPPLNNVAPPVNVGGAAQGKKGALWLYGPPTSLTTDYDSILSAFGGNVVIGSGPASQKFHVQGGAYISGNLGIGVPSPVQKLDVLGTVQTTGLIVNGNADINGTTETDRLRVLDGNFAAGNALISDGAGNASWTKYDWYNVSRIPPDIIYGGGAVNIIPKFTSVNPWRIGESIMSESGGNTININGSANIANNLTAGGLTVNGNASINDRIGITGLLTAQNIRINGNTGVNGNVNIGGLLTASDLRNTGDANITGTLTTLYLTVNNNALTINGTLTAPNLLVSRDFTVAGLTQVGTLGVTGAALVGGTLTSTGLKVNGDGNITGTLGIVGTLTSGGLTVNGNGNISGTLGVSGVVTAPRIQINGDANVTGRTTTRDLTVNSAATFNGLLTVQSLLVQSANIGGLLQTGTLGVTGNALVGGTLTSTGLTVNGNGNITGALTVNGNLTSGGLQSLGNGTINGNLNIGGTLGVGGGINVGTLINTRSLRVLDGNRSAGNTLLSDGAGNASWGQYSWTNIINMPPNFMAGEIDWSKVLNKPSLVNTITSANGRITVAPNNGNVVITRAQPTWADLSGIPANLVYGSGAANYITKWTGSNTIGISALIDSGGGITVPGSITAGGNISASNVSITGTLIANSMSVNNFCISGNCQTNWPVQQPTGGCQIVRFNLHGTTFCPSDYIAVSAIDSNNNAYNLPTNQGFGDMLCCPGSCGGGTAYSAWSGWSVCAPKSPPVSSFPPDFCQRWNPALPAGYCGCAAQLMYDPSAGTLTRTRNTYTCSGGGTETESQDCPIFTPYCEPSYNVDPATFCVGPAYAGGDWYYSCPGAGA